jgi:hypothetical protein
MSKHTTGPWFASVHDDDGEQFAVIRAIDSIAGMRNSGDYSPEEFESNAHLIAAAPELWEALRIVADEYDDTGCEGCGVVSAVALQRARAALAKAEGRS